MSHAPTRPASRPSSEVDLKHADSEEASSELVQSLDTLLEQYLHLLDRQQHLQAGLSKHMSSGFFALAHANYTCSPGRRYGSDYYDQRMKANWKISIKNGPEEGAEYRAHSENGRGSAHTRTVTYNFCLESTLNNDPEEQANSANADKDCEDDCEGLQTGKISLQQAAIPQVATGTDDPSTLDSNSDASLREVKSMPKKFRSNDPIHWYGILVPPSLRTAQESFRGAIMTEVPELAETIVEMRVLEQQITQLRSELDAKPPKEADPTR